MLIGINLRISKHFISPKVTLEPSVSRPKRMSAQPYRPPHVCGSGVRVSALLRRGAAPYADGCEHIFCRSHLISLPILVRGALKSRLTWHDFVWTTMAPASALTAIRSWGHGYNNNNKTITTHFNDFRSSHLFSNQSPAYLPYLAQSRVAAHRQVPFPRPGHGPRCPECPQRRPVRITRAGRNPEEAAERLCWLNRADDVRSAAAK